MKKNSELFQPIEEIDVESFGDNVVARIIIMKLGKSKKTTKVFVHERGRLKETTIQGEFNQLYGGKKKKGEPIAKTAKRELREELGISDEGLQLLGASEYGGWLNYYFILPRQRASRLRDRSDQKHLVGERKGETIKAGWFTLHEINRPDFPIAFNHREVANEAFRHHRKRNNN